MNKQLAYLLEGLLPKDNIGTPDWTGAVVFSQRYHWIA